MSAFRAIRTVPRLHPTNIFRTFTTTTPRNDIAKVQLIGRIGTEPEVSQSTNGNEMTKYTLAVNMGNAENRTTSWYRIIAFGEGQAQRLQKGSMIWLDGDLKLNTYDGEDGKKHTRVTVIQRSASTLTKPAVNAESAAANVEPAAESAAESAVEQ